MILRYVPVVPLLGLASLAGAVQTGLSHRPAPGEAEATVGGFTVDHLHYVLDPEDLTRARSVTFDLRGGRPRRVAIRTAGRSAGCRLAGTHATCDLDPGVPVHGLEALRVVAS